MLRLRNLFVVFAAAALLPSQALGQAATIKFTTNPNWVNCNSDVSAAESYTVAKGFVAAAVTLYMVNPKGGRGYEVPCKMNTCNKTWSGTTLGPVNTTHTVYARITVRQLCTTNFYYFDTSPFTLNPHP